MLGELMKDYLLFMDVSGDVAREYIDDNKVKLVPMEFIINCTAHEYTGEANGLNVLDFYKQVKARADIKRRKLRPQFTKSISTNT